MAFLSAKLLNPLMGPPHPPRFTSTAALATSSLISAFTSDSVCRKTREWQIQTRPKKMFLHSCSVLLCVVRLLTCTVQTATPLHKTRESEMLINRFGVKYRIVIIVKSVKWTVIATLALSETCPSVSKLFVKCGVRFCSVWMQLCSVCHWLCWFPVAFRSFCHALLFL